MPLLEEIPLLRVSGEPYTYLSELQIHEMLTRTPAGYYLHVRSALERLARSEASIEMPPKLIFTDPGTEGDFRVMPCVIHDAGTTTKSVKLVGTNVRQQQVQHQITVGKSFLIDNLENYITHIFEACLLSSARTAICANIAIERLGGGARHMTLVGAGRVGYYCAYYALALDLADEVVISDTCAERAAQMAAVLGKKFPGQRCSAMPYERLDDTGILVLATTSLQPVYHPDHFAAGLVVSVGADIDFQHELAPELATGSMLCVDTLDSIRYGDLKLWIGQGRVSADDVSDLLSLLVNPVPVDTRRRRVFISTGSAMFDNLTMAYLVSVPHA